MSADLVAFDLELSTPLKKGPIKDYRTLKIACAVTVTSSGHVRHWTGPVEADGRYAEQIGQDVADRLAKYLYRLCRQETLPLTWCGTGLDFPVLFYSCSDTWKAAAYYAAVGSLDPAYQMLAQRGYLCSLDAACKGMGMDGKTGDIRGADAPQLWTGGDRATQERVLAYCEQDARMLLDLYQEIHTYRHIKWLSKKGAQQLFCPAFTATASGHRARLLTVAEAHALPEPEVPRWMKHPLSRTQLDGWLRDAVTPQQG